MLALSTNGFLFPFKSLSRRRICTDRCLHLPLLSPLFSFSFSRRSNTPITLQYAAASSSGRDFTETPVSHAVDGTIYGSLSSLQKEQISIFVSALLEWNERMNLTAAMQKSEVMTRHVEDSLALLPPLRRSYLSMSSSSSSSSSCSSSPSCDGIKLVDVGSGSGLPGLILAIACPTWKVTLLESMQKRCTFLEYVVGLTNLSNVEVLRERAEDQRRDPQRLRQRMAQQARIVDDADVVEITPVPAATLDDVPVRERSPIHIRRMIFVEPFCARCACRGKDTDSD